MIRSMVNKSCRALAVSAVAVMSLCGPAKAAEFVVNWDPILNPGFSTTLGWKGYANVSIPNLCLAPAPGDYNVAGLGCGAVTMTSYTLEFYDSAFSVPVLGTVATAINVTDIRVGPVTGLLDGVDLAGEIFAGIFTLNNIASVSVFLDFVVSPSYEGPTLRLEYNCGGDTCTVNSATEGPNAPVSNWVPEPTSLLLVASALAALGLRRRKA